MNHVPLQIIVYLEFLQRLDFDYDEQQNHLNLFSNMEPSYEELCLDQNKMHLYKNTQSKGQCLSENNACEKE
jgi:hypothetical protein